jgi:hypothetical protein
MRKFDIIVCSVLKMKGCRNAPAVFAMSACLVPVIVTAVKFKYLGKTCPSDHSSAMYPFWTGLGMNLEIQSKKELTDRLTT